MTIVTVSPGYRITIPQAVRNKMPTKIGDKFQLIPYEDTLELIPVRNIQERKGFLQGIDTIIDREKDRL